MVVITVSGHCIDEGVVVHFEDEVLSLVIHLPNLVWVEGVRLLANQEVAGDVDVQVVDVSEPEFDVL